MYKVTEEEKLLLDNVLVLNNYFRCTPAGQQADNVILSLANNWNGAIISNDQFVQYAQQYPWLKRNASPLRLFKGSTYIHENNEFLMVVDLNINCIIGNRTENILQDLGLNEGSVILVDNKYPEKIIKKVTRTDYWGKEEFGVISKGVMGSMLVMEFNKSANKKILVGDTLKKDEAGNKGELIKYGPNKSIDSKYLYTADDFGNKTEELLYGSDGNLHSRIEREYDSQGNKIKENSYDDTKISLSTFHYKFDSEGKKIEKHIRSKGKIYSTPFDYEISHSYIYNNLGKLIEKRAGNETTVYIYDDQNNLMEDLTYMYAKVNNQINRNRKYNKHGKVFESTYFNFKTGESLDQYLYYFDNRDNQIEQIVFRKGIISLQTRHKYEYDEFGNWICEYLYTMGKLEFIAEREIEYY